MSNRFFGKAALRSLVTGVWASGAAASAAILTNSPVAWDVFPVNPVAQLLRAEQTLYEGTVWYGPALKTVLGPLGSTQRVFWWSRLGGEIRADDAYFFPGLWVKSTRVSNLMADIGVSTALTQSDAEIWDRMNHVWYWMAHQTVANGSVPSTGIGFPSISDMALFYEQNGYISRGSCQSTAQLMATLMARAGIPANRFAMAHAHWGPTAQHVFIILLTLDGWYYLDPSYCTSLDQLPAYADRTSFGLNQSCDYTHPFEINVLPGSDLNSVPWCLDAD